MRITKGYYSQIVLIQPATGSSFQYSFFLSLISSFQLAQSQNNLTVTVGQPSLNFRIASAQSVLNGVYLAQFKLSNSL